MRLNTLQKIAVVFFFLDSALIVLFVSQNSPTLLAWIPQAYTNEEKRIFEESKATSTTQTSQILSPKGINSAHKNSKITSYLEVNSCAPYPHIMHAEPNSAIVVKNSGKNDITLKFVNKQILHIEKHSSALFLPEIRFLPSLLSYTCDKTSIIKGGIWLE